MEKQKREEQEGGRGPKEECRQIGDALENEEGLGRKASAQRERKR